jgi:hypothetical protein
MAGKAVKVQKQKEKFDIKEIYTPLSVAKKEIWKRWNDPVLRKKVEDFLGGEVPRVLKRSPRAVLARHVASPNNEFMRYLDLSKIIGLEPKCLEYFEDKFRAENQDKYYLGKLFFCNGVGKKWGERTSIVKAINFDASEGKQLTRVKTLWGEDFIKFHHRLLSQILDNYKSIIVDESVWIKNNGKIPSAFYENFLSLFICFGVLFEDYLENKNEKEFTTKIVIPAFSKMYKKFGVKPLIVKIYPSENENDLFWRHYPAKIEKTARKMVGRKKSR